MENTPPFPPGARLNRPRKHCCISSCCLHDSDCPFLLLFTLLWCCSGLGTGCLLYVLPWALISWCGLEVHPVQWWIQWVAQAQVVLPQLIFPFPCHTEAWVGHAWALVYYCFPNHFQHPSVNLSVSRKRTSFLTHQPLVEVCSSFLEYQLVSPLLCIISVVLA